jgi:hypothetical protein
MISALTQNRRFAGASRCRVRRTTATVLRARPLTVFLTIEFDRNWRIVLGCAATSCALGLALRSVWLLGFSQFGVQL